VSTCAKSHASIVFACAVQNSRHVGPTRRGLGSTPTAGRMFHTVAGQTWTPRPVSSPCTRRYPQPAFSRREAQHQSLDRGRGRWPAGPAPVDG